MNNMNMSMNGIPPSMQTNIQTVQLILSQTSSLLRTLLLACILLNLLLFLSSFLTLGVQHNIGMNTFFTSILSCGHTVVMIMVLSPHISSSNSDSYLVNNNNGAVQLQLDQILQYTSHQYTNNPLAYGSIMGGTAILVPLMRFISASFGGIAQCVANRGTKYMHRMHDMHMMHGNVTSNNSAASYYFDSYGVCGASGPVHFVSFLSSILSWVYLAIAVVLYTRRNELLEGSGGGGGIGGGSYQYDEIGESQNDVRSSGFAGDFPNGGVATTMQV